MISGGFPDFVGALPDYIGRFKANRLGGDGCEILFATYPAGTSVEEHDHATDNWGVITMGALFLTMDGAEQRYGVGDWYAVKAGQLHCARFEEATSEIEFWFEPK